jgi:hypothetical protein
LESFDSYFSFPKIDLLKFPPGNDNSYAIRQIVPANRGLSTRKYGVILHPFQALSGTPVCRDHGDDEPLLRVSQSAEELTRQVKARCPTAL